MQSVCPPEGRIVLKAELKSTKSILMVEVGSSEWVRAMRRAVKMVSSSVDLFALYAY